jgi:hypothetical protein
MELFKGSTYLGYYTGFGDYSLKQFTVDMVTTTAYKINLGPYGDYNYIWISKGAVTDNSKGFKLNTTSSVEFGQIVVEQTSNIRSVLIVTEDITSYEKDRLGESIKAEIPQLEPISKEELDTTE